MIFIFIVTVGNYYPESNNKRTKYTTVGPYLK